MCWCPIRSAAVPREEPKILDYFAFASARRMSASSFRRWTTSGGKFQRLAGRSTAATSAPQGTRWAQGTAMFVRGATASPPNGGTQTSRAGRGESDCCHIVAARCP